MSKVAKQVPGSLIVVDTETGHKRYESATWNIVPPAGGKCPVCAAEHDENQPHNQQSLPYQAAFAGIVGRSPTWADAVAHCPDEMKRLWTTELKKRGAWSEPPNGEEPIEHHGI